ncbi:uncharacterized protein LOC122008955 isoform X1 [Zingiber officinale]|uniref:uncharacterized protein LOC122008955 isoform X1 n=1 Tax=Zingiber officinale TaxID=94328 RepID=UPI001C4C6FAA|nr:uncharacterized protein LOC122008955 isoform X1 [Zingiber officinale]XP_042420823.1 uncharacterized protein LOC122008955 isoform X1 [Zingiber officinale]
MAADSNMGSYQANLPSSFHHPLMVSFQSGAINSLSGMVPDDICSLGGKNNIVGQFDSLGSGLINHMDAMTSIQYSAGSVLHEPVPGFEHVSGSPANWSQEEIEILHVGLIKYSYLMGIRKYIKISAMLRKKTIRDVALMCQSITLLFYQTWSCIHKETGKRQKMKEYYAAGKTKDMLDKMGSPSSTANISMAPTLLTGNHMKIQDSIPSEAPSLEHILDENNKLMDAIAKNIDRGMLEENINLFHYVKNNISIIENRICVMSTTINKFPGSMRQMPILRVSINDELLASLINHTNNNITGALPMNNYQLDTICITPNIRGFREHT